MQQQQQPIGSFRRAVMRTGTLQEREGCCYVEFGRTKVVCTVDGPKEATRNADGSEGRICVSLKECSSSSSSSKEGIRNAIESALRCVVCLELFCKAQIDVEITVLEDDGGVLAASLIAASLGLIDSGIQVYDVCVAAHVVMLPDGRLIVDPSTAASLSFPCDSDEYAKNTHLSVTVGMMPSLNQLTCCEFVGIASPDQLRQTISAAVENSLKLYPLMRKTLSSR